MDKKPVLLLLNDIHFGKDNLQESIENWREALSVCEDFKINRIVVGGDMFQSRASQTLDVLMGVYNMMEESSKLGIEVVLARGNHDTINQNSFGSYCHLYAKHPNVSVIDDFCIISEPDCDFTMTVIPYFPEQGMFLEIYEAAKERSIAGNTKRKLLYLHEGINGALSVPSDHELPSGMFKDFDHVLVGHYHGRCKVKNSNVEYIGSSRQHNFGEDEIKGYTVVYSDGSTRFIQNESNLRYRVYTKNIDEIDEGFLNSIKKLTEGGSYKVKIKITCTTDQTPNVPKKQLIEAGVSRVEVITEDIEIQDVAKQSIHVKFNKAGVKNTYQEFCQEKNIADVEIGLAYLDKIEDVQIN